jgi:predicted nucleic acid-binding protein
MIVADTDVLIDALRGREPGHGRIAVEVATGRLATTVISVFELESGAGTPREADRVAKLLAALSVLVVDEPAARAAAAIRRDLERTGSGLATADYLIAGICLARSALLLTRNRSHFARVPGLSLGTLG